MTATIKPSKKYERFEVTINDTKFSLEKSEVRELIQMLDNGIYQ